MYPIKHLSVDSDADADLVKICGLTWMTYLGIRTSMVTMHAPCVVHTTAVGQRRRNYDVTIARHQTLRSHAWRITGGSRHALTPQYLDKTEGVFHWAFSGGSLAMHESPADRRYFSQWNARQRFPGGSMVDRTPLHNYSRQALFYRHFCQTYTE